MSASRPACIRAKTVYPLHALSSLDKDLSNVENIKSPCALTKQNIQPSYKSNSTNRKKHLADPAVPFKKHIPSETLSTISTFIPINEFRMPLRTVSLNDVNDDLAEKRRRRKSNKILAQPSMEEVVDSMMPQIMENSETSPSSQPAQSRANALQSRPSLNNIMPLNTIEEAPLVRVPLDVMSSNFEEWMKLATDNKINPTNSWNFALIDYFHDMSLLRNVTDNSINFQKASCTLDGCVKIWTSRVDSVGTETFKLVSNLASEGTTENLEDPSDQTHDPQKKRTNTTGKHRTESTLAKSAAHLRTKKLELEFMVDPLFKKTCADFDESGAQGLLMNHLNLGLGAGCLRVVFDAGDCVAASGENREEEDGAEIEEPEDMLDLSYLRREFLPSIDVLGPKAVSHSLETFSFERGAFDFRDVTVLDTNKLAVDGDADDNDAERDGTDDLHYDNDNSILRDSAIEPTSRDHHEEDFFVGDQAIEGDCSGDNYGDPDVSASAYPNSSGRAGVGPYEPFDPRRVPNERDIVMAMTIGKMEEDESGNMMDYFEQNFLKNWAGPEHWKVKRAVRHPLDVANANAGEIIGQKGRREKKDKGGNKIDFAKLLETNIKELFGPFNTKINNGTKVKGKDRRSDQTLPDDMHFSSKQLVTLFLKPRFSLKMRGRRARINERDGEVDERFWAQAAANQAQAQLTAQNEIVDGDAIPFNTQFFHDDYEDGPGFEDIFEGEGRSGADASVDPEEQDLLAATEGRSRRRPEFVNYVKRAKRVDVRKLKENIWKGLSEVIESFPEDGKMQQQGDKSEKGDVETEIADDQAAKSQSDGRVLENVVTRLKESYPPDKMSEISTSFCFICLLHLANEEGLRVKISEDDENSNDDFVEEDKDKGVGNLWNLQIFKDPNAVFAA